MFFKKSEYKQLCDSLNSDLSKTIKPFLQGGNKLSDKELRESIEALHVLRDTYTDRVTPIKSRKKATLKKTTLGATLTGAGGFGTAMGGLAFTADIVMFGGIASWAVGASTYVGIMLVEDKIDHDVFTDLDNSINTLEEEYQARKSRIKNTLTEKHKIRKAFVAARRKKELNWIQKQKNTTPSVHKKPLHKNNF